MPFTPFHLGPALLLGVLCLGWLDFPTFLVVSVLVDCRATLVFFGVLDGPLHGPLHTVLGAAILAGLLTAVVVPVRPYVVPVLEWFRVSQPVSALRILAAAVTGAWLHVLLDAMLYINLQPFAPVSASNPLLGLAGPATVYTTCVLAGLLGIGAYGVKVSRQL